MSNHHVIGKFCSVAKKGTIIFPKNIPGYLAPEGQVLKEDGQKIEFVYTPIKYNISYNIGKDAEMPDIYKTSYTIEDEDYIPSAPTRDGYKFNGWNPKQITHGSIGDITFTASWTDRPIFLSGKELNTALDNLANGKENIMAIQMNNISSKPNNCINLSSTGTPIYAWFDSGIVYIASSDIIYCNMDMSEAFKDMTILRDISCFSNFVCRKGTDIRSIFENDYMLSDVQSTSLWADNGNFKDFSKAFLYTSAASTGRVPTWYKWDETFVYESITGIVLDTINTSVIPNSEEFAKSFNGYKPVEESIIINDQDSTYTFYYSPIEYTIDYITNGGELINPKDTYTIEDESYYPPNPVKPGYAFDKWEPECINTGDTGNIEFVAVYKSNK